MSPIERVRAYFQAQKVNIDIIEMDEDTSTAYLAATALGTEVGQIAKSILFKSRNSDYLMVVSAGDVRIDTRAIKELVGVKVRMANGEEVQEMTGFNIGGVCPFALQKPIPIYLDESLKRYPIVYAAAGTSNTAVPVSFLQLQKITGGSPCQVTLPPA
ncbi:MAG TPA: YbaK/EbsC family protein [Syntrophomonadaceae bacterium]|nr:YbaK/EbsC family protein [Syntrophomonadaceae bacterium]